MEVDGRDIIHGDVAASRVAFFTLVHDRVGGSWRSVEGIAR